MAAKVVEAGGYTLHLRCVAGVESCCYVDSVDVAFDLGCIVDNVVNKSNVFITHGHTDHISAFVAHAARRALQQMKPAKYHVPAHLAPHLESILQSTAAMQGGERFAAQIVPMHAFDEVQISPKWVVRAVPTTHQVPSLGYILYQKRTKLRPEYALLEGREIAALRLAGNEVTSTQLSPEVAYTGDTTIETFAPPGNAEDDTAVHDLLRVKVLITEATYADDKMTVEDAVSRGHMHLDQIATHEHWFRQVGTLVLVHFSARFSSDYLEKCIQSRLPPALKEKTVLGC